MTSSQVQAIVDKATQLGLEDHLVVATDNEYVVHVKNQTSRVVFDNTNGIFWAFRTNVNPLRAIMKERPFMIEAFDYEHIVSITIEVAADEALEAVAAVNIDEESAKAIIREKVGEHQADNYNIKVDENGDPLPSNIPANMDGVRLE